MLIVYQSLESTGTKADTAGTALSGNSFKKRTQANAHKMYPMDANRVVTYPHPVFDRTLGKELEEDRTITFADDTESKALSNRFKNTQDRKEFLTFLAGVIDTIKKSTMNRARARAGVGVRPPEIIVLGEIHGSDLQGETIAGYEVIHGVDPTGDARHRFTVLKNTYSIIDPLDIKIHHHAPSASGTNKDENAVCMMLELMGWLMAFVHTPNSICGDRDAAANYIKNNILRTTGGSELDLLVGDTNQPSDDFVKSYMKNKFGGQDWTTSIHEGLQEVVGFGGHRTFSLSGTNSGFDTHFDIACTRHTAAVIQKGQVVGCDPDDKDWNPVFAFHGLTDKFTRLQGKAYAYSDHNGIIIEVLRRKDRLAFNRMKNAPQVQAFKQQRAERRLSRALMIMPTETPLLGKRSFHSDDAFGDEHRSTDELSSGTPLGSPMKKLKS
ncbi:hypothetical protein CYFUS_004934 [Cystobacter fuscus]|uniref:Uncharacterized protein n=1 Tax=Cystobacter fuscus TaxID=43 RepID=A0A250J7I2_9BACT|nr:hypothetical protein [Cystobacter fuscus]ATB39490.1 hypothetical protein CYFUS_004934 [Cystobacter fuscus]